MITNASIMYVCVCDNCGKEFLREQSIKKFNNKRCSLDNNTAYIKYCSIECLTEKET